MISEKSFEFLKERLANQIAEFLDDPDGMCGPDAKEIGQHYEFLCTVCRDCEVDFWQLAKEEDRTEYEEKRLKEYLAEAGVSL